MAVNANPFSLAGKSALVTGASRGIGRAIALAYAQAGADVACVARSATELDALAGEIRVMGRSAVALQCDVTNAEQIASAVDRALEQLGKIDILVNNAGSPLFNAPFLDIRPEGWTRVLELNLLSVVGFCRAVGRHMVARSSGSVINIDSLAASRPAPFVSPYCAAKAAVMNLTQVLAQEWGPAGVRVNAVGPGWINTRINRALHDEPDVSELIAGRVPMRRWGQPADITGAALWLASDASSYVTGVHITIDGGVGVVAAQWPSGAAADNPADRHQRSRHATPETGPGQRSDLADS